jgi:transketolase
MCYLSGASHVGASLSCVDLLTVLFFYKMKITGPNEDIFILSKGHASAAYYATLAHRGYFPVEELETHCANGSKFYGLVTHQTLPTTYGSTGSLGHGLPIAVGLAIAKIINKNSSKVFCLLGDGECQEGSVWEAASIAAHYKLENLVVIIDNNGWQAIKETKATQNIEPLGKRWQAFGWRVVIVNGHDYKELLKVMDTNIGLPGQPLCIIARTVKGKGISFMENNNLWHYRNPTLEEFQKGIIELEGSTL